MMIPNISPTTVTLSQLLAWNQRAQHLALQALRINAVQGGVYLSRFKGRGMEFEEVRRYQPGDDVRNIDWRVTARTQKVHTKLFQEEKERPVLFCLDLCRSLFFGSRQAYKAVIGAHVMSLLAWAANHHHDRVGGMVFSEKQQLESAPQLREKGVLSLIRKIIEHEAWAENSSVSYQHPLAETAFLNALLALRKAARPGSLVFIISDWYHASAAVMAQVQHIAKHSDMVMIFLYDRLEAELPPKGIYPIQSDKQFHFLDTRSEQARADYQADFQNRAEYLETFSRRFGIKFVPCATHANIFELLNSHFNRP